MTGRAAGYCAGYEVPGFADAPGARGRAGAGGSRAGAGRGFRRMYYATGLPGWMRYGCRGFRAVPYEDRRASEDAGVSQEREKELLGQQVQFLRNELEIAERRINDLAGLGQSSEHGPEQGSTEGGK